VIRKKEPPRQTHARFQRDVDESYKLSAQERTLSEYDKHFFHACRVLQVPQLQAITGHGLQPILELNPQRPAKEVDLSQLHMLELSNYTFTPRTSTPGHTPT
jgi:hypothetical protein